MRFTAKEKAIAARREAGLARLAAARLESGNEAADRKIAIFDEIADEYGDKAREEAAPQK